MKAEEYAVEKQWLGTIPVRLTIYRIGSRFHCHIENADPGATIARAEGATRVEATTVALSKAVERLKAVSAL